MEKKSTDALQAAVFHRFKDVGILRKSLMHRSNIAASAKGAGHNQRLEFLGDRVLGLIIATLLYEVFPQEEEGALARRLAGLVSRPAVVQVARCIALADYLELPASSEGEALRALDSTLEDACEALIGALYLDGGLAAAECFVRHYWTPMLDALPEPPKDAKTALQEWAQSYALPLPVYREVGRDGPAHAPQFEIEVTINPAHQARATGATKKAAEQAAAMQLLERLHAGKA
jgi:ribonuclease-3